MKFAPDVPFTTTLTISIWVDWWIEAFISQPRLGKFKSGQIIKLFFLLFWQFSVIQKYHKFLFYNIPHFFHRCAMLILHCENIVAFWNKGTPNRTKLNWPYVQYTTVVHYIHYLNQVLGICTSFTLLHIST